MKLAHDVYVAFADLYDARVFSNIAESEARHQAAVGTVLERYGYDDPVMDLPAGEFEDERFDASKTRSFLESCARHRRDILTNFLTMGREALARGGSESPYAFLIPPEQHDPVAAAALVDLLARHGVRLAPPRRPPPVARRPRRRAPPPGPHGARGLPRHPVGPPVARPRGAPRGPPARRARSS